MRLDGQVVLLTGASGGLGRAIARAVHARGARVVASGRDEAALESLREELGERVEVRVADLAQPGAPRALVEGAADATVLIANAGLPASGRFDGLSPEQVDRVLDVNLRAPMQMAHAIVPRLLARRSGHVVLVSSVNGKVATARSAAYSATKFGLRGFGLGLREDLHGSGVGVTVVYPGFISDAGMWAKAGVDLPPGVTTRSPEQVGAGVVRGIERDSAEVDVAPALLRVGGWVAGAAPAALAALNRRLGSTRIADQVADAQRDLW